MTKIDTPQLAYPLEFKGGRFTEVEQGSLDELAMSIEILLRYPQGLREDQPDFGVRDLPLRPLNDDLVSEIRGAIVRWRGEDVQTVIDDMPDAFDDLVRTIVIKIQGRNSV
jgi:phage baseplate assembly protein W